jgi:hypothetical protein
MHIDPRPEKERVGNDTAGEVMVAKLAINGIGGAPTQRVLQQVACSAGDPAESVPTLPSLPVSQQPTNEIERTTHTMDSCVPRGGITTGMTAEDKLPNRVWSAMMPREYD